MPPENANFQVSFKDIIFWNSGIEFSDNCEYFDRGNSHNFEDFFQ